MPRSSIPVAALVAVLLSLAACSIPPVQVSDNTKSPSPPPQDEVVNFAILSQQPLIKSACEPVYPTARVIRGVQGRVVLNFVVGADGKTREISCIVASDPAFVQPAMDAVRKWTFIPGYLNGKAVATRMQLPIVFSIVD